MRRPAPQEVGRIAKAIVRRALRQVESIGRRRYRYEHERPHLVRERVKCGKSTCACARDRALRHGPYTYFRWERWERWDTAAGRVAYHREYVPRNEVVRVRRWIHRYRHEAAQRRGVLIELRRLVASEVRRAF